MTTTTITTEEALTALWEAREQLESEALDARETGAVSTQPVAQQVVGDQVADIVDDTKEQKSGFEDTSVNDTVEKNENPVTPTTSGFAEDRSMNNETNLGRQSDPYLEKPVIEDTEENVVAVKIQKSIHPAAPAAEQMRAPEEMSEQELSDESQNEEQPELASEELEIPTQSDGAKVSFAVANGAPDLMNKEITQGLNQLLKQWPYFKGSGMLGFGPGGLEHPTYKRIANTTVAEVLTGRWDEPDQGLIKEIREYVNGWKREQGLEPHDNETFEVYLRRVVADVLNKRSEIDARTA